MEDPRIRKHVRSPAITEEKAIIAIETVRKILSLMEAGPFLTHRGPRGEIHYDIPLMYQGFALDRLHYDPWEKRLLPKGMPHVQAKEETPETSYDEVAKLVRELRVLDAVEFREPEQAWLVPIAWRSFIVAHIKVDVEGKEVVPDYHLTEEAMQRV